MHLCSVVVPRSRVLFCLYKGVVLYCAVIPSIAREGFCVVKSYKALCRCS